MRYNERTYKFDEWVPVDETMAIEMCQLNKQI